ncbi:Uncharacterized protein HZ326_0606 [Fusarium oxysporum f. sp. albedinis]|nr:Uncharacterized protein HZ326_0606 [Fusarium oxysporum f. sp. albedinis]
MKRRSTIATVFLSGYRGYAQNSILLLRPWLTGRMELTLGSSSDCTLCNLASLSPVVETGDSLGLSLNLSHGWQSSQELTFDGSVMHL